MAAVTSVGIGGLVLLMQGRGALALALGSVFLGSLLVFWALAGQHLADLPAFLAGLQPMIGGFTEAMALPGPLWQPTLYALLSVLLLSQLRGPQVRGRAGMGMLAGTAIVLFLGFKAGFVRHDGHALISAGALALVGWVLMLGEPGLRPVICLFLALGPTVAH